VVKPFPTYISKLYGEERGGRNYICETYDLGGNLQSAREE
jgi:hypothetical protein